MLQHSRSGSKSMKKKQNLERRNSTQRTCHLLQLISPDSLTVRFCLDVGVQKSIGGRFEAERCTGLRSRSRATREEILPFLKAGHLLSVIRKHLCVEDPAQNVSVLCG